MLKKMDLVPQWSLTWRCQDPSRPCMHETPELHLLLSKDLLQSKASKGSSDSTEAECSSIEHGTRLLLYVRMQVCFLECSFLAS